MQTQKPKTSSNSVEQCIGNSLNLDYLEEENDQKAAYRERFMGSSSTLIGDYIGIESCLDLKESDDIFASPSLSSSKRLEDVSESSLSQRRRRERDEKWGKMKKEFPPPIPLLARTGNLLSHMPWVLKRYYTDDGRLILREERVKHHEYFKAQRCNGRLILQLVPLDDEVYPPCLHNQEDVIEEEETVDCSSSSSSEEECNVNDNCNNENTENEGVYQEDQRNSLIGGNVSAFKCFNYNTMRQLGSACIFDQLPVPALRPVHS